MGASRQATRRFMAFPVDWPEGCQPEEAESASGEVFRLVKSNPHSASLIWRVSGKPIDAEILKPLDPLEVLYHFDGPRTFTNRDRDGQLYLAHGAMPIAS